MQISLKTRLTLSIALLSLLSIVIISIIVNFFLEKEFRNYAMKKQEQRNQDIVTLVSKQYQDSGNWNVQVIENIGVSILEESLILSVKNSQGDVIWDALEYNSGICQAMIDTMANRMLIKYPSLSGGLTHKEYILTVQGQNIGTAKIGYYGPFYYTDSEFFFIETINKILLIMAFVSLLPALIFGYILSTTISAPIAAVTRLSGSIAQGDYQRIEHIRTSTREVQDLIQAINHMSASLSHQEKLRQRLSADVAHELRTPLTTLRGELEAMIDGIWDTSISRLKSCHEEILRITNLIADMQALSRYEGANMQLKPTTFNLKELAEKVISHHENLYKSKQITVSCRGDAVRWQGDKEKLSQVILNLFTNACKFTPAGGRIDIELGQQEHKVLLLVTDSGMGIPAEDLPFIFERFYRVDASRTRGTGGAGIGLSIAKEIVKAHGGQIRATSTPGQGTTILVSLPWMFHEKQV